MARLGPLNGWFVSGFGEGERAVTGVSTGAAHYYLMEPSPQYGKVIFPAILEKAVLSKVVVMTLEKAHDEVREKIYDNTSKFNFGLSKYDPHSKLPLQIHTHECCFDLETRNTPLIQPLT